MIYTEKLTEIGGIPCYYQIRHDGNNNAIHAHIHYGEAIVFKKLEDLFAMVFSSPTMQQLTSIECFFVNEDMLKELYKFEVYDYDSLHDICKKYDSGELPPPAPYEPITII